MENFPSDSIAFQKTFATDEQCGEALAKIRWPKGFLCPNCGHGDGQELSTRMSRYGER